MRIVTRKLGDVIIFDLRGDLLVSTLEEVALQKRVKSGLEEGVRHWLVNLAEVPFMDSSGFGELLSSFISARNMGGQLKLEHLAPKVRLIFDITGLPGVFEIFDDEEAAIRSFHGAKPPGK
jgi:anti-sigma B factor antagonist